MGMADATRRKAGDGERRLRRRHGAGRLHKRRDEGTQTSHRPQDDASNDPQRGGGAQQEVQRGNSIVDHSEKHAQATAIPRGNILRPQGHSI